jgi:glycosyltransferase involved in cell wall biosynthesis
LKITIITVCFNAEKTIRDTIESVLGQAYQNLDYLIIDGGSKDGTLAIIQEYTDRLHYVSELDHGIYDAMNKGIAMATGEVIGILNADDVYQDMTVLGSVAEAFCDSAIDACFADLLYVKQNDITKVVRYWKSSEYRSGLFKTGWVPAHPTFFTRMEVYNRHGQFNLDYRIAGDFELMFRLIEVQQIRTRYIPSVFVRMRLGGESNKSLANLLKQNREVWKALKSQYPDLSWFRFLMTKLINRCGQFLTRTNEL